MKRLLTLLTVCVGLSVFPYSGNAQEHQGCYMLDANGNPVDLNGICSNNTSTPGVFRSRIKRRQSGIPVIEVTFNQKHTVEMMVDTGASGTVLSPEVAKRLGVEVEGSIMADTPSQRGVRFPAGRVASVSAGGAVANNVVVIISPALSTGLLGQNFFGRYDVVIKENVVEFHDR